MIIEDVQSVGHAVFFRHNIEMAKQNCLLNMTT